MYFFYVDETGNRNPKVEIVRQGGRTIPNDWLYVLTAVSLFEHRWHGFDKTLSRRKRELIERIYKDTGRQLDLADCELKSNWVRIPKERARRPFLASLSEVELKDLVDLFYRQLSHHPMFIFSVVVDKRHLFDYMTEERLHRKGWELLLERVEYFMRSEHDRHQAVMVADDVSPQMNRSLAMKHAFFQDRGTSAGLWLRHISEMPLFVRSELSNGVQLADMVSYNIYRAFRSADASYPYFARLLPCFWSCGTTSPEEIEGLKIFPDDSPLHELRKALGKQKAQNQKALGS
jgi:hypothetical protein